ncbi:hypothetical protein KR038_009808 [Drosophila bunnanda]|nr:hypothetical protein KR038_009808 [Drosophila bunnanda]
MSRISRPHMPGHDIGTSSAQTDDDKIAERNSQSLSRCIAENTQLKEELLKKAAVIQTMRKMIVRLGANQRSTILELWDVYEALERTKAGRGVRGGSSRSVIRPRWSILWSFLGRVRQGVAMVVSIAPQWMNFLFFAKARRLDN